MLPPNVIVSIVLVATLLFVGLYDVAAALFWGPQYTISAVLGEWSRAFPVLTLTIGIVIGHLFWPISLGKGTVNKNGGKSDSPLSQLTAATQQHVGSVRLGDRPALED